MLNCGRLLTELGGDGRRLAPTGSVRDSVQMVSMLSSYLKVFNPLRNVYCNF
jgi:hypothetical protein